MVNEVNFPNGPQQVNPGWDIPAKGLKSADDKAMETHINQIKDDVMLSPEGIAAQAMIKLRKEVDRLPEVDEELVRKLKTEIQSGDYLSPEKMRQVAEKMIQALQN